MLLFIHETPVHFAIAVLICAITLGSLLLAILAVSRAEGTMRWTRIFGLLFVLSILLMYLVFAISIAVLPATASVVELFPFYIVIWGFAGLHGFFIIVYHMKNSITPLDFVEPFPFPVTRPFFNPLAQDFNHLNYFAMEENRPRSLLTPITRIGDDIDFFLKHILNKKGRRFDGEN